MNILYTFGCSFTAPYTVDGRVEYRQYFNYKGDTFPNIWPNILSNKLNLELRNLGIVGSSNYEIFGDLCRNINNFKEGDVVIVGWTYKERFRLVNDLKDTFTRVAPNFRPKLKDVSNNTIDEILINRENKQWVSEVMLWDSLITKTLELMGVKLITWTFDYTFPTDKFILNDLFKLGAETINKETQGLIQDSHMGEVGHQVQADYFYDLLMGVESTFSNEII